MRAISPACVWAATVAMAACAAAQSGPAATSDEAKIQPYVAISSTTTLDGHGTISSTVCCSLVEMDLAGRKRTAHIDSASFDAPILKASIRDPVAMTLVMLDYKARKASITQFPPTAASKMMPNDQPFPSDDPDRGDLGEKTIDGVKVHGYMWTTKGTGAGSASTAGGDGTTVSRFNSSAYPVYHEWWWSPELRLFALITERDREGNQQIQRYEKIELKEPSPGDFSIPRGFQVKTTTVKPDSR